MATVDDVRWHAGGEFPAGLAPDAAATHIGMFVAWLAEARDPDGECLLLPSPAREALRSRVATPGRALLEYCGGTLSEAMLSARGTAFAHAGYDGETGSYLDDYVDVFDDVGDTIYEVPDTWGSFQRIAPWIDARFRAWLDAAGPSGA